MRAQLMVMHTASEDDGPFVSYDPEKNNESKTLKAAKELINEKNCMDYR